MQNESKDSKNFTIILVLIVVVLVFCLFACVLFSLRTRNLQDTDSQSQNIERQPQVDLPDYMGESVAVLDGNPVFHQIDTGVDDSPKYRVSSIKYEVIIETTDSISTYAQARLKDLKCEGTSSSLVSEAIFQAGIDESEVELVSEGPIYRFTYGEYQLSVSCSRLDNMMLVTLIDEK